MLTWKDDVDIEAASQQLFDQIERETKTITRRPRETWELQ